MVRTSPCSWGSRAGLVRASRAGMVDSGSCPQRGAAGEYCGQCHISPYLSVRGGNVGWIRLYWPLERTGKGKQSARKAGSFRWGKHADRPKDVRGEAHHGRSDDHVGRQRPVRRRKRQRRRRLVHATQAAGGASGRRAGDDRGTASGRDATGPQVRGRCQRAPARSQFGAVRRGCRAGAGKPRFAAGPPAWSGANTVGCDRPTALHLGPASVARASAALRFRSSLVYAPSAALCSCSNFAPHALVTRPS